MKERILQLIENQIIGAQDNAFRARRQFGNMTPDELEAEYGQSGRKCKDVLADNEDALKEANEMKEWLIANTHD